jgi:hypothetical protein
MSGKPRDRSKKKYHGRPCKKCGGTERYSANWHCVSCQTKDVRLSRDASPEKWNNYAAMARYAKLGLTTPIPPKRANCDLCGSTGGGRGIALDHDHQTGACRGWLCHNCNLGLGNFRDNPELMRKAAEYAERGGTL